MASLGHTESWRWQSLPKEGTLCRALTPSLGLTLLVCFPVPQFLLSRFRHPSFSQPAGAVRGEDTDDSEQMSGPWGDVKTRCIRCDSGTDRANSPRLLTAQRTACQHHVPGKIQLSLL